MSDKLINVYAKLSKIKSQVHRVVGLIKEFFVLSTHRDAIVHIGHFSNGKVMSGNIGDPLLYYELENLYDKITGEKHIWYHRKITWEVSRQEIWLWNRFAKGIIVGGHGLLMVDTGRNDNSGWQFNINLQLLRDLSCPLAILAIGYNTFRGQQDFNKAFGPHINECARKSIVFGLRNYGSIRALSEYLDSGNKQKICFQPCPTTMLSLYEQLPNVEKNKSIGICLAFDRFQNRFGKNFNRTVESLLTYKEIWEKKGYNVFFFVHNPIDLKTEYAQKIENHGGCIYSISGLTYSQIFEFYLSKTLIVGMRGHSLMIPWGLRTPVISLTTQNKQKWFIEITGHDERSIEVELDDILTPLNSETEYIVDNYEKVINDIIDKQKEFYSITQNNLFKVCKAMQ